MIRLLFGAGLMGVLIGLAGMVGAIAYVRHMRKHHAQHPLDEHTSVHRDISVVQIAAAPFASSAFAFLLGSCLVVLSYLFGG